METKHTPGPWHHNGTEVSAGGGVIVRSAAAYDALRKDLDLIVAAPDLLDALQDILTVVRMAECYDEYQAAEAAIAKALQEPANVI